MKRLLSSFIFLNMTSAAYAEISVQGLSSAADFGMNFVETADTNIVRGMPVAPGSYFFNTQFIYTEHPLVERLPSGQNNVLVDSLQTLSFTQGVLLTEKLRLSANISLNTVKIKGSSEFGLGDSALEFAYRLSDLESKHQFALIPSVVLPTGDEKLHLSSGGLGSSLLLAASRVFENFKLSANVGYRYQPSARWRMLDYSNSFILGAGAEVPVTNTWSLTAESIGFISTPYKMNNSEGEISLGALWNLAKATTASFAVSSSGFAGDGNESMRMILGFKHYFAQKDEPTSASAKPVCDVEPLNVTFHSRPLTEQEKTQRGHQLPYRSEVQVKSHGKMTSIQSLSLGESTGVSNNGIHFVEDAQIPFAIEVNDLPPIQSIKFIHHAQLKIEMHKISEQAYIGTEILCSMDFKICSGEPIALPHWLKALNKDYFNESYQAANKNFSKVFLDRPIGKVGHENLYSGHFMFSLQSLFENSPIQIIDVLQKARVEKNLYFVIADDTYPVNGITLELSLGVERCR